MKKHFAFILPLLVITSCGKSDIISPQNKLDVYLDYSEASTSDYRAKVEYASASKSGNDNYRFSLSLSVKNLTTHTQNIVFSNVSLVKEDTRASYSVYYSATLTLDSEIEGSATFTSTIPTSLQDKYYFSVDFKNIRYKVNLYETPDELREVLTVTYKIDNEVVHTETVKKGRSVGVNYIYEADSHQTYSNYWRDPEGHEFKPETKVESNITVSGVVYSSLQLVTTSGDAYTYVNGINHVHSDGKVVVLETYQNKEVVLGNYAIYNNYEVKEVYLPATLHYIYNYNFSQCGYLKTIYFAGTEEQWNNIPKSFVTIPSTVSIVFNTSY